MPKGAKKGKAATPTEIRRNARALMTESAAYREAAEKAERSDRSPDRDMSIFLRDALAQEIEVATDILMRASDKASDCADLTRAYEHARRTLENPLGKDLSEEQTDKKQKKKTYADKAKTPATESTLPTAVQQIHVKQSKIKDQRNITFICKSKKEFVQEEKILSFNCPWWISFGPN